MSFTDAELQRLEKDLQRLERADPRVGAAVANYKRVSEKIRGTPLDEASLALLADHMERVSRDTYWLFFWSGIGTHVHAFIEFNGLLSKYAEICRKAAEQGVDFTQANTHTETPLPVEIHDLLYVAEKLDCILGPLLRSNPKARRIFFGALGAYEPEPVRGQPVRAPEANPLYKLCTCTGTCKGAAGLGEGWICALEALHVKKEPSDGT